MFSIFRRSAVSDATTPSDSDATPRASRRRRDRPGVHDSASSDSSTSHNSVTSCTEESTPRPRHIRSQSASSGAESLSRWNLRSREPSLASIDTNASPPDLTLARFSGNPVPEFFRSTLQSELASISDDLCRAWDCRWSLVQSNAAPAVTKVWQEEAVRVLERACGQRHLWPYTAMNRIFAVVRIVLDVDSGWKLPSAIRAALPLKNRWPLAPTPYRAANMITHDELWSPVETPCTNCAIPGRVKTCTILASPARSDVSRQVTESNMVVGTWGDKFAAFEAAQRNTGWSDTESALVDLFGDPASARATDDRNTTKASSEPKDSSRVPDPGLALVPMERVDLGAGDDTPGYLSPPATYVEESDSEYCDAVVYRSHGERSSRPVRYPNITQEGSSHQRNTHDETSSKAEEDLSLSKITQQVKNLVASENAELDRIDQSLADIAKAMELCAQRFISLTMQDTTTQETRGGSVSQHTAIQDSSSRHDSRTHGAGLRIGPWQPFREDERELRDIVEELINALPDSYQYALPVDVFPERNRSYAVAVFEDTEDRDAILRALQNTDKFPPGCALHPSM
ncbi:hypothetical protein AURDEDRAFT_128678 [Auricularia subglabra TFB-10046 SS5]|nr:hypothetical protein AURDEDRAFT_128678 [Auricularia subglabra TFB-10046 SS5]